MSEIQRYIPATTRLSVHEDAVLQALHEKEERSRSSLLRIALLKYAASRGIPISGAPHRERDAAPRAA